MTALGDHRRDFAGVARSTKWDAEPFLLMGILVRLVSRGDCGLARSDRVRGDLVLAQLKGQCLDQSADAILGGVVAADPTRG